MSAWYGYGKQYDTPTGEPLPHQFSSYQKVEGTQYSQDLGVQPRRKRYEDYPPPQPQAVIYQQSHVVYPGPTQFIVQRPIAVIPQPVIVHVQQRAPIIIGPYEVVPYGGVFSHCLSDGRRVIVFP